MPRTTQTKDTIDENKHSVRHDIALIKWDLIKCLPSLVPRLLWEGEERAWYILFAHALNHPNFPGIGIFSVHFCVTMTSRVGMSMLTNEVEGR